MSTKNGKLEKLKKLQALRNAKNSQNQHSNDDINDNKIYDEIDEIEYRNRKRQELLHDDFVIDDDGKGYVDRGIEDEENGYYSDELSEEDDETNNNLNKKNSKSKKNSNQTQISDMLRAHHSKKNVSNQLNNQTNKRKVNLDEFDDILGDFEADTSSIAIKKPFTNKLVKHNLLPSEKYQPNLKRSIDIDDISTKKQKTIITVDSSNSIQIDSSPLNSQRTKQKKQPSLQDASDDDYDDNNDVNMHSEEFASIIENSPTLNRKASRQISQDEHNNTSKAKDESDDDDEDILFGRRTIRSVTTSRQINLDSKSNPASSPFVTAPGTPSATQSINIKSSPLKPKSYIKPDHFQTSTKKYSKENVIKSDSDSFHMFWMDFCEVDNSLILFGKVKTHDGTLVSAMLQINNLNRELFFLPREGKTPEDVHEEIIPLLMDKYGLDTIRAKPERKKYCFEIPDIPTETYYLKVLLPYKPPKSSNDLIPAELSSDTFYHVFGGNTNIFESFVIQNKVMGPCWLKVKNGDFNALQNASHCQLEIVVNNPKDIVPIDLKDMIDLDCVSLSLQTVLNAKANKQEIVSITLSTYKNIAIDSPIPEDIVPNDTVTLIRPPVGSSFPLGLATLGKEKLQSQLRLFNNEKTMLMCFAAMMKVLDPDVIIGHRLETLTLDVLSHRLNDLKVPTFSSLGRRVRKDWPPRFGKNNGGMNSFLVRDICSGRLLCDISNEMGQSLTPKCQSWDLAEMYNITCGRQHKSLDINYQNKQYQEDVNSMLMAIQENITNSILASEVSFRIQLLSLTKQLTTLAGNAWSQTLGGTRAGRNEYILLHEFSRNNYILPDKESNRQKAQRRQQIADTEGDSNLPPVSNKKAKYQGGLVFEPEKGLHKNYILVMDFNSLYPSIIQEFNICFTTVDRNLNDIDELPEVPASNKAQGVLPRLLATLVQRRREVKKVMASETDLHKKVQCDIRQQALKLTANSMYGCLGYNNSRFYAKPLAMLTTNKGREILMNTRQLAESLELAVVYGDTDSVMIDTGCDNYNNAIKIGQDFKKLVNERYRLLEIDIDNVFKKLLLHAKKKYAALNVIIDKQGNESTTLEVKGLDMKRREYCPLSKEVSIHVLNTVLSDKDSETALSEIYEYLERTRNNVENNDIRIDKYKINTKLSKDPNSYPNKKTMPAVQVALKMRKAGRVVKAGSVITFIITKGNSDESEQDSHYADRAYALNEVMNKSNNLVPDPTYYLEKQIFSPVERLLENIESFDIVRLSTSLGLDSKKFLRRPADSLSGNGIDTLQPLETTVADIERFKDSSALELTCPNCANKFLFGGIIASNFYTMCYNGLQCKNCEHIFSPLQITSQLERCIRSHISLYYAGWLVCDDKTCGTVTRQISVFGKRCLSDGCTGVMRYKYSDKKLYNQLLYFDSLFDCEKNKNQLLKPLYHSGDIDYPISSLNESSIKVLSEQNRDLFETNRSVVQKYLSDCARRYVDLGSIFEFMRE
ncbi:hypothetical protein TBLA_0B01370 [Henningerozyma blattae CBS 6284]|uniref:DNA polymerase n=1 Tax=Henningerozyma blattae (strain ATCC 34711 / CBS 6284 / DSM 70876 / NBRC 10599 / NRRL Y-10934 / UCD 77-7) TaxID=1071380 RepID=I2GXX8_HENB6|nr:hypothetical protein TBLA_0B01370 [Tetrapisispora blattae CBS 6284]CCH58980.1 hypothetical protein TBLA_0B01370 [Tetrapisispora blattae CBS 6284]